MNIRKYLPYEDYMLESPLTAGLRYGYTARGIVVSITGTAFKQENYDTKADNNHSGLYDIVFTLTHPGG